MSIATLTAFERNESAKQVRSEGFTPAVIYGYEYENGHSIKFKSSELLSTVRKHGANARVSIDLDGDSKYGAIKEVQLHPVTNEIRHIDIQVFKKDDVVKLTVPIHFTGMEELIAKRMVVSTLLSEIEFTGPAISIPQSLTVDLSKAQIGDVITVADLEISDEFKLSAELEDTVVTVSEAEVEPEETEESEETAEVEVIGEESEEEVQE